MSRHSFLTFIQLYYVISSLFVFWTTDTFFLPSCQRYHLCYFTRILKYKTKLEQSILLNHLVMVILKEFVKKMSLRRDQSHDKKIALTHMQGKLDPVNTKEKQLAYVTSIFRTQAQNQFCLLQISRYIFL